MTPEQFPAVAIAVHTLLSLGEHTLLVAHCPECTTPILAAPDQPFAVCGYCGAGPTEIEP